MDIVLKLLILFVSKVVDNTLGTAKTILIQNNRSFLAGICLGLSKLIYFKLTKDVVMADGNTELYIIAVASAVGCWLAIFFNNRLSKDKTYINVIMSDDMEEMKKFRDFLAEHKITNIASDSYTRDWTRKTLTITAYAETKQQSSLIDEYIENSDVKFKRRIQNRF